MTAAVMSRQKKQTLESFNLGLNPKLTPYLDTIRAFKAPKWGVNTLGYDIAHYTMIHEFGHYITSNNRQASLLLQNGNYISIPQSDSHTNQIRSLTLKKVTQEQLNCLLSSGSLYYCVPTPANEFVSAYAGSSIDEDAAESFAHFILSENKPQTGSTVNNKILLFYQDAQLVKMRDDIRANLKKLTIIPKSPNSGL